MIVEASCRTQTFTAPQGGTPTLPLERERGQTSGFAHPNRLTIDV
jgi:hypothetical protein